MEAMAHSCHENEEPWDLHTPWHLWWDPTIESQFDFERQIKTWRWLHQVYAVEGNDSFYHLSSILDCRPQHPGLNGKPNHFSFVSLPLRVTPQNWSRSRSRNSSTKEMTTVLLEAAMGDSSLARCLCNPTRLAFRERFNNVGSTFHESVWHGAFHESSSFQYTINNNQCRDF